MNNKKILAALIATGMVTFSGYGFYQLGLKQGKLEAGGLHSHASITSAVAGEKKVLYWHDPMVPGQKFDKPGKSPFMDMPLVPVYADSGDEGSVNISPRVQQNLGVRMAEVTRSNLSSAMVAVGSVAYNERDVALVQARSNGFVEKLYVRAPLDTLKKGQALAELYVPDWVAAQEEYLTAKRMQASGIAGLIDGAKQRMRLAGMSDDQIHAVEASGKVNSRIVITAPISGVVTELSAREGMTVITSTPLFRINALGAIWVNADIPENQSARIHIGTAVEASTPSLSGITFKGKVNAILPQIDVTTRTLKARIELANPSGQLVPGMFANLSFNPETRKDILQVPTEAVIQTGNRTVVMVAQGDGKFNSVDVEAGAEANGQTEIRKGLEVGQKVVVSGQFLIDSEASLRGTATRMGDTPGINTNKAAPATHHGSGKVEKIDKNEITLSHRPIPSLEWKAMTMGFKLPQHGLPANINVGDMVIFDLRQTTDGTYQITAISPQPETPKSSQASKAVNDAMKSPSSSTGVKK
ncbi:efflux RND transporter periplasmic adaptor subunit [Undibacterium griseum]|uniref:Efflux RND transporter periplasmic adaptor subunit n=1 Tax=Undibacterium griseum TaxID=2762295 RepID=A0ABR6YJL7_9BURK|nr:efflux RND transporter periplasmic adaptor subunit [Undibacterium griseum]MBC3884090.1 efflux RND transporter periplasmic adaptor subunit [Undibacterium griseum]